jgi:DNA-binding transcriptional LysR family regulator
MLFSYGLISNRILGVAMDATERIERRLKLHELRVLMSVVDGGSMGKAAKSLATSQPAVSRAIADLEYSLGVRLLDRGPHGIVPTPYGRALVRRSVAAFDELRQGVKDIEFLADPTAGEVRIATPITAAAGFLAGVIDTLARRHPRVVCHLITGELPMIYRALEERAVDAVVMGIPTPLADHLQAEVLYTPFRRRFYRKSLVAAAPGNARGSDERALDAAAARQPARRPGRG